MALLVNVSHLRAFLLKVASEERPAAGFTRVSRAAIEHLDAMLREYARDYVRRHPSNGKTIR